MISTLVITQDDLIAFSLCEDFRHQFPTRACAQASPQDIAEGRLASGETDLILLDLRLVQELPLKCVLELDKLPPFQPVFFAACTACDHDRRLLRSIKQSGAVLLSVPASDIQLRELVSGAEDMRRSRSELRRAYKNFRTALGRMSSVLV
jgi:hypothetical protein